MFGLSVRILGDFDVGVVYLFDSKFTYSMLIPLDTSTSLQMLFYVLPLWRVDDVEQLHDFAECFGVIILTR